MTQCINSLAQIAQKYDAIIFDQWGVLHDGSCAYAGAIDCLVGLAEAGHSLSVLSNSGKRAAPNAKRISDMGFSNGLFNQIMTSGEALWHDIDQGKIAQDDALAWAEGLRIALTDLHNAQAVPLMGLPDAAKLADWQPVLDQAFAADLPIYCSNPDQHALWADGLVISAGALARAYSQRSGRVIYYGKPHRPVFQALSASLKAQRFLMVGDSLDHDIADAQAVGWDSVLIQKGLYASAFSNADHDIVLKTLLKDRACQPPNYSIEQLQ
jgi:HAD superfamily hydrolase (TIGR01459 family)